MMLQMAAGNQGQLKSSQFPPLKVQKVRHVGSACQQGEQQSMQSAGPGVMAFVAQTRSACDPCLPTVSFSSRSVPATSPVHLN